MIKFNDRIKQILLLLLIILLVFLSLRELTLFLPGILGAITLYILSRANYFQLVYNKKWKKGRAAGLYIAYYLILLGIPVFLAVTLISPKINSFLSDPTATITSIKQAVIQAQQKTGITFISEKSLSGSLDELIAILPSLFNSTAMLLANLATMLFFLYYMLYYSREMEKTLFRIIPLKDDNTTMLATETKKIAAKISRKGSTSSSHATRRPWHWASRRADASALTTVATPGRRPIRRPSSP
jgi:predicted PurR-regulated permease PerM